MTIVPRILAIASIWLLAVAPACSQDASTVTEPNNLIGFYTDIGRIKWTFAKREHFTFGVPHFTVGPRVLCTRAIGAECEIEVSARKLGTTDEDRRAELLKTVSEYLRDAAEQSPRIQSVGSPVVEYVALTHKQTGAKIVLGFAAHGPYAIRFRFLGQDPDNKKLSEVLTLVQLADALDRNAFLAFKLADEKVACDKLAPETKGINDRAYGDSPFAHIDYAAYFFEQDTSLGSRAEVEQRFAKTRQEYIKELSQMPKSDVIALCRSFPAQIANAEQ